MKHGDEITNKIKEFSKYFSCKVTLDDKKDTNNLKNLLQHLN